MLVPLQERDFDRYVDFAYELALNPEKTSYPAYFDGVKTKEEFISGARDAFASPNEEILLYMENGEAEGWIHCYTIPEEHYVGQVSCSFRSGASAALDEYAAYLAQRYPGYDWEMGFPAANRAVLDWLEHAPGFTPLEDSHHYQLLFEQYEPLPEEPGIERITEENFEKFRKVHQTIDSDMYWNARRIRKDLPRWDLYVAEEDGVTGEIASVYQGRGCYHPFAVACSDGAFHENLVRRLLIRAMNDGKARGAVYLPFFVDLVGESEMDRIMPELGFQLVGRYIAYRTRI